MKEEKQQNYDFDALSKSHPPLAPYISQVNGRSTIDFGNAEAIKALNIAILLKDYGLVNYDLPDGYLIPGVSGRRKYLDQVANLLKLKDRSNKKRRIADLGVGGNCIYPIIGRQAFGWEFIGVDSDQSSLNVALEIITANNLSDGISLRLQSDKNQVLEGWITEDDYFDCIVCNPPFYSNENEANHQNRRKNKKHKQFKSNRTFGGKPHELITKGGELGFVSRYLAESKVYGSQVYSFTCLISSGAHLKQLETQLKELKSTERRVIETSTSNKSSRILVWSFLTPKQREVWRNYRWK